jgi:hypothetical protein
MIVGLPALYLVLFGCAAVYHGTQTGRIWIGKLYEEPLYRYYEPLYAATDGTSLEAPLFQYKLWCWSTGARMAKSDR